MNRIPLQIKAQQNKVARAEEALREAQDALKKLKVANLEKEASLKAIHDTIRKHQRQLNEAGGKKEYDALNAEIAVERHKAQKLEEEIFNGLMQVEERTPQIPELEKTLQQARQECTAFEKSVSERQTNLKDQFDKAQAELKDVEAHLPEDIRPLYQRLVATRGEEAMAAAVNRSCVACYTEITAQMHNDLLAGRFVLCKTCGRLLYLPE
jgi:predicted  nucleic acid-binding Zn-ribbon protein